jgi:hypothetical protein
MVVNFKAREISRGMHKLTHTYLIIIIKKNTQPEQRSEAVGAPRRTLLEISVILSKLSADGGSSRSGKRKLVKNKYGL